jgi:hypothetical protein
LRYMDEISIVLRDSVNVTTDEFKALGRYSHCGNVFTVIQKYPCITARFNRVEYIFDPEALLMYKLTYNNILAYWDTECTKTLPYYKEYKIQESIYIVRPYSR